jgi:hypothetical protein
MIRSMALLLAALPLAAAEAPAPAPAETPLVLEVELRVETVDGKAHIAAAGKTSLPDGTILKGSLHYLVESRPVELVAMRREEVRDGAFAMRLDTGFREKPFPGAYQVSVAPDALSSQPPAVQARLSRKVRLLRTTRVLEVGAAGAAQEEERKLREAWRAALFALLPLVEELDQAVVRHAKAFNAAAWSAWATDWRTRLGRATATSLSPTATSILPRLNPDWTMPGGNPPWLIRDELVHAILGVAALAETFLPAAARDADTLSKLRRHIAYQRQQLEVLYRSLPIFRADAGESKRISNRLRGQVADLQAWLEAHRRNEAGRAAADWPAWVGAWRAEAGRDLLRLSEGGSARPEGAVALQAVAASLQALEQAAEQAVSGGNIVTVPPAVEAVLRALDALDATIPKD